MSTQTATPATLAAHPRYGLRFGRILRSELLKLTTVPSTVISFGILALTIIAIGPVAMLLFLNVSDGSGAPFPIGIVAALGSGFAQLVAGVLGVLAITGEHATGSIRSSLAAVPRRVPFLAAKAVAVTGSVFVATLVSLAVSFAITLMVYLGFEGSLPDGVVADAVVPLVGTAVATALLALFALGIGAMLRMSAGAITIVVAVLLVLPALIAIPIEWVQDVMQYQPGILASTLGMAAEANGEWWRTLGLLAAWAIAAVAGGLAVLTRRDA